MAILQAMQVSKTYRTFRKEEGLSASFRSLVRRQHVDVPALRSASFNIERGEFVGLLGPNGAGKTTLLKIMTGLIQPTAGRAVAFETFDTRSRNPEYLRRIGLVMGQRNQLNPDLPAIESFRLAQAIYDIDDRAFQARLSECMQLFAAHEKLNVPVRKLSLGERMKMEITLSLLHRPELLFLDEPTIGLDFQASAQIRQFLSNANSQLGVTVVLTSHYTKDIEELCKRVIVINTGSVVFDGQLDELDDRLHGEKIVSMKIPISLLPEMTAFVQQRSLPHQVRREMTGEQIEFEWNCSSMQLSPLLAQVLHQCRPDRVTNLNISDRPLEEIFRDLYRRSSAMAASDSSEVGRGR